MNILEKIENALVDVGIEIASGQYPENNDECGKIIFDSADKPTVYMDGRVLQKIAFKVVLRGMNYKVLEQKQGVVQEALNNAGCMQIGQLEDIAPKDEEKYLQIGQSFRYLGITNAGHSQEDIQEAYNQGYEDGYLAGVESVDVQSYYDKGYADGISSVNNSLAIAMNPTTSETASIIYASGSSGNHAFIDRYALAKVASVDAKYIRVSGVVTCNKVMNTTTSSTSNGMWRLELVDVHDYHDSDNSFEHYKNEYTSAFDTQSDLASETADGSYETHRTPTNNTDTIDINKSFEVEPNKVYVVILTYGVTGLGYYADSVVSSFEVTIETVTELTYAVSHQVMHLPEKSVIYCKYNITMSLPNVPAVATTTPEVRGDASTKFYWKASETDDEIEITQEVSNATGNPNYNEVTYFFGTGNGNNTNSLSYKII